MLGFSERNSAQKTTEEILVATMASSSEERLHDDEQNDLSVKLKCLQCPFTWDLPDDEASVQDALETAECKANYFKSLSSPLVLCFEYAQRGDLERALKVVGEWNLDEKLDEMEQYEDSDDELAVSKNKKDLEERKADKPEKQDFRVLFYHVFFSCECFVLFKLKRFEETKETLSKIVFFENMSRENQTRVYKLKCSVLVQYGYPGRKRAFSVVENLLMTYPESSRLRVLWGKLKGKVRRIENRGAPPSMDEMGAYERVLEVAYDRGHAVQLAGLYREYSRYLKSEKEPQEISDGFCKRAYELYCKVYDDKDRQYRQTVRCAEGFTRLPYPWKDLKRADCCLKEALQKCPEDPYLNHIAGSYYFFTGDLEEAKYYLKLASSEMTKNLGACNDLIFIKQKLDKHYDPVPDLELLLNHFSEDPQVEDILCCLGVVSYIEKKDFEKAFGYWSQVIEKNIDSQKLKKFFCRVLRKPQTISINGVIIENIQKRVRRGIASEEERSVLSKLLVLYPNMVELESMSSQLRQSKWPSGHRSSGEREAPWHRTRPLEARQEAGDGSWRRGYSAYGQASHSSPWRSSSRGEISKSSARNETSSFSRREDHSGRGVDEGSWRSNFKRTVVLSDDSVKEAGRKSSESSED